MEGAMVTEAAQEKLQGLAFHDPIRWRIVDHDVREIGLTSQRAE
jgi:hypothetical protein